MAIDREARIVARRARIAGRLKAAKAAQAPDSAEEGASEENQPGFVKSQDFAPTLLKAQLKGKVLGLQSNSNDRNFTDKCANTSRHEDLEKFKSNEKDFSEGVAESTKNREALHALKVPQELHKKITALCEAYESMINSKDKIIGEIYKELEVKDEEYSVNVKEQAKDVKDLISFTGQQLQTLREFYLKELTDVETKLIGERKAVLDRNKVEMTHLIQERQDVEVKFHEDLQACKEEFERLLNDIREGDIETFNALKIRLEKDAQNLEQHLQNMRAVYQLNVEKLEYNFLVLTEREKENYIMSNQQKKKLTKQRDALSNIKGRHRDLEKQFTDQNEKLTDDYTRVNKLLLDLQRKQQSLQLIHTCVHHRFFFMHQHTISALVSSVLQADKQVQEGELGWRWRMPSTNLFCELGSGHPVKEPGAKGQGQKKPEDDQETNSVFDSLADECYQLFMESLIFDAGFLIDNEANKLLAEVEPEFLPRARCVLILRTLGVRNTAGLEKIYNVLTDKKDEEDPIVTIPELKGFVKGEKVLQEHLHNLELQNAKQDIDYPFKVGPVRAKALALKLKWDEYWRSFTLVVSPQVLQVWKHLESALVNYNQILKDRYVADPWQCLEKFQKVCKYMTKATHEFKWES